MTKAARAVEAVLEFLGRSGWGYDLKIESEIPVGKGMSSSSADVAAAAAAVFRACGLVPDPDLVADIAARIEPTDGVMLPGIVVFDHLSGRAIRRLGAAPDLELIVVDSGGEVDTLAFNSRPELAWLNQRKEPEVRRALEMVEWAIRTRDVGLLGEGASLSAMAHQDILPKPELPRLAALSRDFGSVGAVIGHSGTVVGLLFRHGFLEELGDQVISAIRAEFPGVGFIRTKLIGGGIE